MEAVQRSTTAAGATARAAEQAVGPLDADPSFGTKQQYVRGGYSGRTGDVASQNAFAALHIMGPVAHVEDTHTV